MFFASLRTEFALPEKHRDDVSGERGLSPLVVEAQVRKVS
jgi:hypothetical protein